MIYTRGNPRERPIPVQNWLNLLSDGLDIAPGLWLEPCCTGISQDMRCVTGGAWHARGFVPAIALRDRQVLLGSRRRARITPREPAFALHARSRNANVATWDTWPALLPVTQCESWDRLPKWTGAIGHEPLRWLLSVVCSRESGLLESTLTARRYTPRVHSRARSVSRQTKPPS